ncbi:FAD binding domain-containing protein [Macroventuria anomochaeta]|uniref:FAD binding domain-containing protein n=1 Tax=Macroventuria anomochaeta TaxID=301207 RepID=A0ACB6RH34_9PLEO|nr:FAD binding domain-containing protein [Macroventuria anomochaeta]KAF2621246.1 FAD binding domain-containing protein [Macroventuria anomochaeta]
MTASGGFRVIIAGGGISGLTLANALEKAGIEYVLLEARDIIAPKVGASIGFFQNGGRILDQLGCLEAIEKDSCALHRTRSRDKHGRQFAYPALFIEREVALRIMYDNLQDKSKIKLQKRISKVDHNENEVTVTCSDSTTFRGDILVGCDGVHSVVRHEMWRLAHLHEQRSFDPSDKESLFAEYQCLFGISTQTKGVVDGEVTVNYDEDFSTMIIGGKQKVFWFMFKKMDKICTSTELPRYTKKDAEVFADNIEYYTLTPELTFGDLWRNRTTYTLVPTEEAQLKRWSWGRIACVGDCVHKMTPNMGAGGNAAMETAAALANELKNMVDTAEKGKPTYDSIKAHLGNYQKLRDTRLTAILKAANDLTRMHALATLKDKIFAVWVLPHAGDFMSNLQSDMITGAVKLDYLPIPERSLRGTMPFNPSQGLGQTESKVWRAARGLPFLGITAAALYFMWGICLPHALERIGEILEKGVQNNIGEAVHVKPLHSFYGFEFLDSRFRGLVACFASLQFVDLNCSWQSLTFLTDAGIVYSILLIESVRRANIMTLAYV